jgi:hypothetical protein
MSDDNEIVYIGKADRSISNRLRQGLNQDGKSGYHGYPWKHLKHINIHCLSIPNCDKKEIQALEAELVYLYRNKNNIWPLYQNEIHFFNIDNIKILANKLYNRHFEKIATSLNQAAGNINFFQKHKKYGLILSVFEKI